jgi:transcriptional regulator with XRE-family HTH domain
VIKNAPPPASTFAERLDYLFRHVSPPGKAEYTYEEVAAGAATKGYEISAAYIWQLRKGKRDNPTLKYVEGLAAFFGVPASYFLDDDAQKLVLDQLELFASLRDAGVESLALRAHGLRPESIAALEAMVDRIRALEGTSGPEQAPTAREKRTGR